MRAQGRALAKVQKQQEAQKRRDYRAAAKAARKAAEIQKKARTTVDREAKKACRQAELEAKVANCWSRVKPNKERVLSQPAVIKEPPKAQTGPNQSVSRSGWGSLLSAKRKGQHRACRIRLRTILARISCAADPTFIPIPAMTTCCITCRILLVHQPSDGAAVETISG